MTIQNISNYISDTKQNILASDSSVNTFAHAVDTNELLLKQQTGWMQWTPPHNSGVYQLPGSDVYVQNGPLTHIDISDTSTQLIGTDKQNVRNTNDTIKQLVPQVGHWNMGPATTTGAPVLHSDLINNLPGLRFTEESSLVTTDPHVRNRPYHGDFTVFLVIKLIKYYNDWGDSTIRDSLDINLDGTLWGSHNTHRGVDSIGGHVIGLGYDYSSTIIYLRPHGISRTHSHHLQIKNTEEPYLSGVDLLTTPMVICCKFHSSHNGLSFADETTDVDLFTVGDSILSLNVCNYNKYTQSTTNQVHVLNPIRIGGDGAFDLGEFILFNNKLTAQEENLIGSHLANKWGSVWQS